MAKVKTEATKALYCTCCGTQLIEKQKKTGFDLFTGRRLYDIFFVCPHRGFFKPWHTKGDFVGAQCCLNLFEAIDERRRSRSHTAKTNR